ncbi:MAG TPA: CHASE2 domain-containing protein [Leptolyngbyaceae cyanobacterium]
MHPISRTLRALLSIGQSTGRTVLLTSLIITAGLLVLRQAGTAVESLELSIWDRMTRLNPDDSADERLLVVGVTEQDIQKYGQPLPDDVLTRLLQALEAQQPRAIGVDIIRDLPQGEGRENLLQMLQKTPNIISVCKVGVGEDAGYPPPPGVPKARLGFVNFPPDPGGVVRRQVLAMVPPSLSDEAESQLDEAKKNPCQDSSEPLFSLGFQVAQQYLQGEGVSLNLTPNEEIQLGNVVFHPLLANSGGYQHADTGGYQMLLRYRAPDHIAPQVTLDEVLTGQVRAEQVRDRIVLIGYVAESVHDLFPTPFSAGQRDNQPMPGVVIHAQLTSQVLSAVLEGKPLPWFWPQGVEMAWIWVWALAGGVLAGAVRHPLGLGAGTLAALGLCTGSGYFAFLLAGWIPVGTPVLAFVTTLGGVILVDRYAQTITKQIKGFLNLDIDIDEVEKETAVAEITESDYFQKLQESGEKLRKQKGDIEGIPEGAKPASNNSTKSSKLRSTSRRDILGELQQASSTPNEPPASNPAPAAAEPTPSAGEGSLDDFFLSFQDQSEDTHDAH